MTRHFAPNPAAPIAAAIPREPGRSDLSRTVQVRLAMESYRVEAPLFGAVRRAMGLPIVSQEVPA